MQEIIQSITQTRLDINYVHTSASDEALKFLTWTLQKHPSNRMTSEEGLQHTWLGMNSTIVRRRENIKFSATRLRQYAHSYANKRIANRSINNELISMYGSDYVATN